MEPNDCAEVLANKLEDAGVVSLRECCGYGLGARFRSKQRSASAQIVRAAKALLELAAELSSRHRYSPGSRTPYPGAHKSGSSSTETDPRSDCASGDRLGVVTTSYIE